VVRRLKKLDRIGQDVRVAALDMTIPEVRIIYRDYLGLQKFQQSTRAHVNYLKKEGIPNTAMKFIANNTNYIRQYQFTEIFDIWTDKFPEARWVKSINGFGPAVAAGLMCYCDFDKANNSSSFAQWAGLTPEAKKITKKCADKLITDSMDQYGDNDSPTEDHLRWICKQVGYNFDVWHKFCRKQGQPYNWNKVYIALVIPKFSLNFHKVCIMIGNLIIKQRNLYQDLYKFRRAWEEERNDAGEYAGRAAEQLQRFDYKPWKEPYKTYKRGYLPPGHIIARSKRWAIKMFLAHYYSVIYSIRNGGEVPYDAYGLDVLKGHRRILVPNTEAIENE
jgi:hypothetical protein